MVRRKVIDFILAGDIHTARVILSLGCDLGDGCSFAILGPRNLDGGNEICLASFGCFFGLACLGMFLFSEILSFFFEDITPAKKVKLFLLHAYLFP